MNVDLCQSAFNPNQYISALENLNWVTGGQTHYYLHVAQVMVLGWGICFCSELEQQWQRAVHSFNFAAFGHQFEAQQPWIN